MFSFLILVLSEYSCLFALIQPGDKVLGMSLNDGGHLTHGHPLNFSGKTYEFHAYGVDKETEKLIMMNIRDYVKKSNLS